MKYNMKQWVRDYIDAPAKKAMPILSFPGIQIIGHTVDELVRDERTGECVKEIQEACEMITDRPVLADIIGPYSLAGRLLDMTEIMILCYEEPEMVETILEKATEFLLKYAQAFKDAGANGIVMAEQAV